MREVDCAERVEIVERFAGKVRVQENDIAPILLGHVAIRRDEAVDASIVAMRDNAAFDFGVIRETVAKAESITGRKRRLRIFHASDGFRLEKLFLIRSAATKKKLDEFREFTGRSL